MKCFRQKHFNIGKVRLSPQKCSLRKIKKTVKGWTANECLDDSETGMNDYAKKVVSFTKSKIKIDMSDDQISS